MPYTDQKREIAPYVRTYFCVTMYCKYHMGHTHWRECEKKEILESAKKCLENSRGLRYRSSDDFLSKGHNFTVYYFTIAEINRMNFTSVIHF